jgi:hypothetical protein
MTGITKSLRIYIRGYRIHHGTIGCTLAAIGVLLATHDRADWRDWVPTRSTQ